MAASLASSIIFFLLFIVLSLFVDGNVFAAQMEHRKLGGAKETMTMRRNLDEKGHQGSKRGVSGSMSQPAGGKTTNVPDQTKPNQATAQGQTHYITYEDMRGPVNHQNPYKNCHFYERCTRRPGN